MITLQNVSKKYGEQLAVDHLNLTINEGEICILLGKSGCGKSTTLKMINRLIEPTSGEIYVAGKKYMSMILILSAGIWDMLSKTLVCFLT